MKTLFALHLYIPCLLKVIIERSINITGGIGIG